MKDLTPEQRKDAEDALREVQATQTAYWHALTVLESVTGGLDLDSTQDFGGKTLEDLIEN